jgi:Tol biopolymer transport system component
LKAPNQPYWRLRLAASLATALGVLSTALVFDAPSEAAFPGKPGRIVFSHYIYGGRTILSDIHPRTRVVRNLTRPTTSCSRDFAPDYSPDGRWIAYLHYDPGQSGCYSGGSATISLWVVRAGGSTPREVAPLSDGGDHVAFSPEGRRIAVIRARGIDAVEGVFDVASGSLVRESLIRGGNYNNRYGERLISDVPLGIDWSTRGLIATAGAGQVRVSRSNGANRRIISNPLHPDFTSTGDTDPDWSPSGRRVVYARKQWRVRAEDARVRRAARKRREGVRLMLVVPGSRARQRFFLPFAFSLYSPVFSPDGKRIAVSTGGSILVLGTRRGRPLRIFRGRSGEEVGELDWQPR